ncbi:flavin reductase family protein [Marinomonas balearica]|uniref:Flavin reductase (DIM6/NTAB) family NADH-FMN oxidoreductase RutF n=1 Tax=Marinomonas balearica TaxID=491947 RepID=A0A4R6M259_9GAMM|nr:flavin reductase family protein [Marinomonas balearica]TDO95331.1 flavin reductase (DIM6/NTAB) family NADH-FMN oxidoreductase RutF [Marinomonas balearica]
MSDFDVRELRNAFGSFLTGVTIVTAVSKSGEKVGFTANSFTSVSMDPPLLLVCPATRLSSYDIFESCDHFAVSILAEDQQDASNIFAGSKGDRFAQVAWHEDEFGSPLIDGAVTHFSCSSFQKVPAGDHLLLIGEVKGFSSSEKFGLGYAKGGYFSLGMEHKAEEHTDAAIAQVGSLVEYQDALLLKKTSEGYSLPETSMAAGRSSQSSLKEYFHSIGISAEVGQVFSVYEKSQTGSFSAYYRAEANSKCDVAECEFVSFDALSGVTFASSDIASMVSRYVEEKQNGVFRLYIGNEKEGEVR